VGREKKPKQCAFLIVVLNVYTQTPNTIADATKPNPATNNAPLPTLLPSPPPSNVQPPQPQK